MEDKKKFGFKQSKIDGSELIFGAGIQQQIPEKYSLKEFLPPVINQGNATIWVPVSISAYILPSCNILYVSECTRSTLTISSLADDG